MSFSQKGPTSKPAPCAQQCGIPCPWRDEAQMQNWQSYVIRLIHPLDHTGNYLAGALHRPRSFPSTPRQKSDRIAEPSYAPPAYRNSPNTSPVPKIAFSFLRHSRLEIFTAMRGKKAKNVTFQTPFKVLSSKHAFMCGVKSYLRPVSARTESLLSTPRVKVELRPI